MTTRSLPPLLALLAALLITPRASAVPEYVVDINRSLALDYLPPCGICHEYGKTGQGTIHTPFAWSMRARGLPGGKNSAASAVLQLKADRVDSDGDGVIDTDELVAGTDPNSPANTSIRPDAQPDPKLGCSAAGSAGGPGRGWRLGLFALLLTAAGLASRRRPHHRGGVRSPG